MEAQSQFAATDYENQELSFHLSSMHTQKQANVYATRLCKYIILMHVIPTCVSHLKKQENYLQGICVAANILG